MHNKTEYHHVLHLLAHMALLAIHALERRDITVVASVAVKRKLAPCELFGVKCENTTRDGHREAVDDAEAEREHHFEVILLLLGLLVLLNCHLFVSALDF